MTTALITYVIDPAKVDAFNGTSAARDWFGAINDADMAVSDVTPGNTRSETRAARRGATPDPDAPLHTGETRADRAACRHRRTA